MPFDEWIKYQMLREDRLLAKHSTLYLVLQNYIVRYKLQVQGRIVLNTSESDVNITANNISRILTEDTEQGNIAGVIYIFNDFIFIQGKFLTKKYMSSMCMEYKALIFHMSYVNQHVPSIFHTESIAEYHEYALRQLLHSYVKTL